MSNSPPRTRTTPMRVADLEAERDALELRLSGLSFRRIADTQGCSVATAHDRVERALAHIVPAENVEALRKIEGERTTAVMRKALQVVESAETSDVLLAGIATVIRCQERYAKLFGLDVPVTQHYDLTITTEVDAELHRLAAELAGISDPESADQ